MLNALLGRVHFKYWQGKRAEELVKTEGCPVCSFISVRQTRGLAQDHMLHDPNWSPLRVVFHLWVCLEYVSAGVKGNARAIWMCECVLKLFLQLQTLLWARGLFLLKLTYLYLFLSSVSETFFFYHTVLFFLLLFKSLFIYKC